MSQPAPAYLPERWEPRIGTNGRTIIVCGGETVGALETSRPVGRDALRPQWQTTPRGRRRLYMVLAAPQMLDFLLRLQASGEVPALFADEFDDLLERAQGNKP